MSHPSQIPERLGAPCWLRGRSGEVISKVALIDASHASGFLACHSPIEGIDSKQGVLVETQVFDALFSRHAAETLIVITGEPGSGKSHLINWLKLRLDDAISRKEKSSIKGVLIKRRAGSLRDALEQLVEQLPEFRNYIDPIRAAIVNLTSSNAKRELCLSISTLLFESPIGTRRLKNLHDFFSDPASLQWLCRDGGAIYRNVQRLIAKSEFEEREALPLLEAKDLQINDPTIRRHAGASVQELLDVFEADSRLRDQALLRANEYLRPALARLTGLGNQTLHQIFRSIRQELKKQGNSLALFIEDVSTLSALDTEVVNALEPQNDPSLCRMYGVLGMTNQALDKLPENMKGRIDLVLSIRGSDDTAPLQTDPNYVDRFIARYLNTLRLSVADVERVAQNRRIGSDVRISACEECKLQSQCFEVFGKVDIEEQEIGLFPFRPGTAHRLLQGLTAVGAVRRNPRGLLEQILTPVVAAVENGINRAPANMGMQITPVQPSDIGSARGQYLGGWDDHSVQRLSYLTWYWGEAETLKGGAGFIDKLKEAFALPKLSQVPDTPPQVGEETGGKPKEEIRPPQPPPPEYLKLIQNLDKWSANGESLKQDAKFREAILPLIRNSIPWNERRTPAEPARSRLPDQNTSVVVIEDMVARPAIGGMRFTVFLRSEETTGLLRVGIRFVHLGRNSWNYVEYVPDRRLLGRWIRDHEEEVISAIEPVGLNPQHVLTSTVRFLIIAYQFSQKKSLPIDYSAAVSDLFSFVPQVPMTLSKDLGVIAQDLPDRVNRVREFMSSELNVPQGTGGVNFIDPLPIIRAIESYKDETELIPIDEGFNESFWAPRFRTGIELGRSSWSKLNDALTAEAKHANSVFNTIRATLSKWDLASESLSEKLKEFVDGCRDVKLALSETKQSVGNLQVEGILSRNDNPAAIWSKALRDLEEIEESFSPISILRFQADKLIDLRESLTALDEWMNRLEQLVGEAYKTGTGGADLDDEIKDAHLVLDSILALSKS